MCGPAGKPDAPRALAKWVLVGGAFVFVLSTVQRAAKLSCLQSCCTAAVCPPGSFRNSHCAAATAVWPPASLDANIVSPAVVETIQGMQEQLSTAGPCKFVEAHANGPGWADAVTAAAAMAAPAAAVASTTEVCLGCTQPYLPRGHWAGHMRQRDGEAKE